MTVVVGNVDVDPKIVENQVEDGEVDVHEGVV